MEWVDSDNNLSVVRQKDKAQDGITRKRSTPNFPENEHFLPPDANTYVCVSEGKKCLFFGKFGVPCFLVTFVLRFVFMSYH